MKELQKQLIAGLIGAIVAGFGMYYTQGKDLAVLTEKVSTLNGAFGDINNLKNTTANLIMGATTAAKDLHEEQDRLCDRQRRQVNGDTRR